MDTRKDPPVTDRTLRYDLAQGTRVVSNCRELTRRALREWFGPAGADGEQSAEDVLLLVSEVVTNACTHGGVPYELRLDRRGGALWVQVSDTNPARPRPHGPHRPARASGHGLYLLQRLAQRWGSVPRGPLGKTVWFEVEVLPPARADGPA